MSKFQKIPFQTLLCVDYRETNLFYIFSPPVESTSREQELRDYVVNAGQPRGAGLVFYLAVPGVCPIFSSSCSPISVHIRGMEEKLQEVEEISGRG